MNIQVRILMLLLAVVAALFLARSWFFAEGADEQLSSHVFAPPQPEPIAPAAQSEQLRALVTAGSTRPSGTLQVSDEYIGVPIQDRPAFTLAHHRRHPEFDDPEIDRRMSGYMTSELMEAHVANKDPIAMFYRGMLLANENPMRALDLYYEAAVGGTVMGLPMSARLLADLAGDPGLPDEIRNAMVHEAHVRALASVMWGYGVYLNDTGDFRNRFPDVATTDVCRSAAGLVIEINQQREARGMNALPLMFDDREIIEIVRSRGMCN